MLVIFKSKAGGDIMMFEENAKQILDLFGKETEKGIITFDEMEQAIRILENKIEQQKQIEAKEKAEREKREEEARRKKEEGLEDDSHPDEHKKAAQPEHPVTFSARAYPFLQLLKAAYKKKKNIYWGA